MKIDAGHHAHLIVGERDVCSNHINTALERDWGIQVHGNPDVVRFSFGRLAVDDARELKRRASARAIGENGLFFIITFDFITSEAQNALLKLLEDPPVQARFFLIVHSADMLLPTLRSRLSKYHVPLSADSTNTGAESFVRANMAERFKHIQDIVTAKDKAGAIALLDALERFLYVRFRKRSGEAETIRALRTIQTARTYLYDTAPSVKMLLEYVAITLPKMN